MGFSNADLEKLEKAKQADERIRRGDHFTDWLALGIGLVILRDAAMREAYTNIPQGGAYAKAMSRLMEEHPWSNRHKTCRSHAMWLADNAAEVSAWRETLAQNEREAINHPSVVKRRFEKTMVEKQQKTNPPKEGPLSPQETIRDLKGQVADLEERNAHLEGKVDGGAFDFQRDSFEDIKAVIDRLPHKSSLKRKLKSVRDAIDAWLAIPAKR